MPCRYPFQEDVRHAGGLKPVAYQIRKNEPHMKGYNDFKTHLEFHEDPVTSGGIDSAGQINQKT